MNVDCLYEDDIWNYFYFISISKNRAFSCCEVFFFKHLTESDIQTLCPNFYDWKRFNSWLFFLSVCYRSVSWQTTPMSLKLSSAKRQTIYRILCENNRSKSSCFNQFLRDRLQKEKSYIKMRLWINRLWQKEYAASKSSVL